MMKTTWKPITAGALDINAGIVSMIIAVSGMFAVLNLSDQIINMASFVIPGVLVIMAGAMAVIGGFFAYTRRHFWFAVAGSACAMIVVLGIPALILVILSKNEFADR